MKISEAVILFEGIIKESINKKEITISNIFIHILQDIKNTNISQENIEKLEIYLEKAFLEIPKIKRLKVLRKELRLLESELKNKYNLILKDYYIGLWLVLGMTFWVFFALVIWYDFGMGRPTTWWMIFGMVAGVIIWAVLDKKAKKENRVVNTK